MNKNMLAVIIVLFTTLFTSSAQIFLKLGVEKSSPGIMGTINNNYIIAGLAVYAIGGALALMAFRRGQVTVVYPIFASSYIWVSLYSLYFFGEKIGFFKLAGILTVFTGISV